LRQSSARTARTWALKIRGVDGRGWRHAASPNCLVLSYPSDTDPRGTVSSKIKRSDRRDDARRPLRDRVHWFRRSRIAQHIDGLQPARRRGHDFRPQRSGRRPGCGWS
jgi:hypothetical protein